MEPEQRIYAIDWMRGFVMILMALDHSSEMWNAGRFNEDSAYLMNPETGTPVWIAGTLIPAADFFTRWVTHLCAPTFLFLTGTSLALSIEKRSRRGDSPGRRGPLRDRLGGAHGPAAQRGYPLGGAQLSR